MTKWFRRALLGLSLTTVFAAAALYPLPPARAQAQQVATIDQLKTDAFKDARAGKFDQTNELLAKAATLSNDPQLLQMAEWTRQFELQRETFLTERHKQYDKAVDEVKLLLKNGKETYALGAASRAFSLADDKDAFRNEPWIDQIVKDCIAEASKDEDAEQWLKALRIYSDLGSVEPANPLWKEKLKIATRRIRLLAVYAPDSLKAIQEGEVKEREEVEHLLRPTTQAAATQTASTQSVLPATVPVVDDDMKLDWHDSLRDVRSDVLVQALKTAADQYYRDVSLTQIMQGGLSGVRAVATTKGLDKVFPGLADEKARQLFLGKLDELQKEVNDTAGPDVLPDTIDKLKFYNKQTINLPEEVMVSEFADGAFAVLDPFSTMIWPSDVAEFNKATSGEFSGIGIQIQEDEEGNLKVVSPIEDSPAYRAGVHAGDIISAIEGKSAKGISLNAAVKKITGPPHTIVTLTIKNTLGVSKDFHIVRQTIQVAAVKGFQHHAGGGWEYFVDPAQKIAYLRLTNFTATCGKEMQEALNDLHQQGAKALILDLRYNPGGLLPEAIKICDSFLTEGVIVSTHPDRVTQNVPTQAVAHGEGDKFGGPLVVLVNQYSASASEIVSGALKDDKRAILVGERTFGKGSVQMLMRMKDDQTYLKLTTSHYYLPSGRCIHREENSQQWGVDPDVKVEMTPEQMRAAIDARTAMDILRDPTDKSDVASTNPADVDKAPADPLAVDPQLSAAVLLLRLKLAGADF